MYAVKHNNAFSALLATSFGHYCHHQANITQFKKGWLHIVHKMLRCMEFRLKLCLKINNSFTN